MPAVKADKLRRVFKGVVALDDVTFELRDREALLVHGPSGSGKSTLLRLLAGLDRPDGGSIAFDGQTVSTPQRSRPANERGVGMVFQGLALWPHLSAEGHLDFVLRPRIRDREERRGVVRQWLQTVGLAHRPQARPSELSGGECQRVALARALCIQPEVLLLDEPFTGLDKALRQSITELLRRLKEEARFTMICVTHYPEEVAEWSDQVLRLEHGRSGAVQALG